MAEATRILVVGHAPRIRSVVRRGLACEHCRVVEAGTGEEGLEAATERRLIHSVRGAGHVLRES